MKHRILPVLFATLTLTVGLTAWASPATGQAGTVEEPWNPSDTGTVRPGMSPDEVIAVWGRPAVQREHGGWTFMYFRNGCEHSCGTFDLVFFERGQVVDAVVRGRGHTYAGISSSPPERTAEFTPPDRSGGAN